MASSLHSLWSFVGGGGNHFALVRALAVFKAGHLPGPPLQPGMWSDDDLSDLFTRHGQVLSQSSSRATAETAAFTSELFS